MAEETTTTERRKGRHGDPLSLFLASRRPSGPTLAGARPFESGEHIWLGSAGAKLACDAFPWADSTMFTSIERLNSDDRLSYGELVALSGDFYKTPEDLFEEKPALLPWLWEDRDLSDIREIFAEELAWIESEQKGANPYPDNNIRMAWNAKGYIELALDNKSHFGWHNMVEYVSRHAKALDLAREAAGKENTTWQRALFTNAFADHFLTDGFAAGHVRVPRAEICTWAEGMHYSEKLAGALSKVLHDQDGHIDTFHSIGEGPLGEGDGLRVKNAAGDSWFTRCDGQLFLPPSANLTPPVQLPVRAVAESVRELLLAWHDKVLPEGHYAATQLVPFPDPAAPPLIEKFSATMPAARFDKLVESVKWYTKVPWIGPGLGAEQIRALMQALPGIMNDFRGAIASALGADPNLSARLAPGYVAGFRTVA